MALLVHGALLQALTYVVRPTISYRALELDVPPSQLGLLAVAFALVPLFIAIPAGRMTDVHGERVALVGGTAVLCATTVGLALWTPSLAVLLLWSVLLGVGHLLAIVGQQTSVTTLAGARGLDSAFGRYSLAVSLGQVLGPGLIALLGGEAAIPDTGAVFRGALVLSGALLLTALLTRRVRRDALRPVETPTTLRRAMALPVPLRNELATAVVSSLVLVAAIDLLVVYLPALGAEAGLSSGAVGLLLSARAAASMVSRFFLGALVARLGRLPTLWGSLALSAVAIAIVPVPMPVAVLGAVMVLAGLALGLGQPLTMAWVTEASPPGARGTWLAVRLSGNRLGQTVVPAVAGLAAVAAGVGGVLWVMSIVLTASAAGVRARERRGDAADEREVQ